MRELCSYAVAVVDAVVVDETLLLEDLGDLHLELRGRKHRVLVLSLRGVPDAGEHVSDWIGHHDGTLLTSSTS